MGLASLRPREVESKRWISYLEVFRSAAVIAIAGGVQSQPVWAPTDERVIFRGVSWEAYTALRDLEENQHLRMTYDRGELESPDEQDSRDPGTSQSGSRDRLGAVIPGVASWAGVARSIRRFSI